MKLLKTACILSLAVYLPFASFTSDNQLNKIVNTNSYAATKAKHTFLVYMVGSDLESENEAATNDLEEMMKVGSDKNLNIVVETGGAKKWFNKEVSNKSNQRWLIEKNKMKKIQDVSKRNMGKPETLKDFLNWGIKTYPADKYSIILWNHGSGIEGYGYDEISEDMLSLQELQSVFKDVKTQNKVKFELVGFDACLMSTIETANIMVPYANYMVASEELEPGHGWDYSRHLKLIAKKPDVSGAELGKEIAKGFQKQAKDNETDFEITLAVTDLSKIPNVVSNLNSLVKKVSGDIISSDTNLKKVGSARSKAEDYGNSSDSHTDLVDLGDLSKQLKNDYPSQSTSLMNSIKDAVVFRITSEDKPEATGLSIYFPYKDKENFKAAPNMYDRFDFSADYKKFVRNYVERASGKKADINLANNNLESKNSGFGLHLTKKEIEQVDKVYSILGIRDKSNPTNVIFVGMDTDVVIDDSTGELLDNFNGKRIQLNGKTVSMFLYHEGDDFALYTLPVMLNGKRSDLLITRSFKNGKFKINGAWEGIDKKTKVAERNIEIIKAGDRIQPLYYYVNENTKSHGYVKGSEFQVKDKLKLEYKKMTSGDYLYGFYILDNLQKEHYTKYINISFKDGKIKKNK